MKKTLLSLLLTLFCAFGAVSVGVNETLFAAAETETQEIVSTESEPIDYAGQATLDLSADSQTMEVSVKTFIDGDTTHFNAPGFNADNLLKARYMAVNTPESTGKLEEWGKKAARFTRTKLETATSIMLESEGSQWEADSTGERYLVWVWYKAPDSNVYRNLNLELLQEGLALGSKSGASRYGELCISAIAQATALKLHVYSNEQDPEFYYGEAVELDLKELRLNIANYTGIRVAFEGVVAYYANQGIYVESFDDETQMYYGIYVYYGFTSINASGQKLLAIGNKVRIVGVVQYYEAGNSYQVSDLKYNAFKPKDPNNIQLLESGYAAANVETSVDTFKKNVSVSTTNPETEETTTKSYKYAELALNTSISMKNLFVKTAYTTQSGTSEGAITLTCEVGGKTVKVRTIVLKDSSGNVVTQDMFEGETIDVQGVIDCFNGEYQIKVLSLGGIKIQSQQKPDESIDSIEPTESTTETTEKSGGCGGIIGLSAAVSLLAATVVLIKKREN